MKLIFHSPADLLSARLDKRAMFQVMVNLLANAIKFTPEEGRIVVTAKSKNKELVIEVADTGVGIPADRLRRIKEPFTRHSDNPHQAQEGVGLGLAIANALVELHGGTLAIESEVGTGTKATIQIPA